MSKVDDGDIVNSDGEADEDQQCVTEDEEEATNEITQQLCQERIERSKKLESHAAWLTDFADIIRYNAQYPDIHILNVLNRSLTPVRELYDRYREKEEQTLATNAPNPPTFTSKFRDVLFFRTRTPEWLKRLNAKISGERA